MTGSAKPIIVPPRKTVGFAALCPPYVSSRLLKDEVKKCGFAVILK
jgi:hypothetical protein